ncbi:MAG TPA: FKBP-type peptidyl-prolyl cis-trans isomerase [Patescibacteria group bacterium]|nr:FKBP-type peptidyl-prolyl cis-trans isomerase [Patescibacteria group bacterium]
MNRRNVWTVATAAAILMAGAACMGAGATAPKVELKTDDDKTLYALGLTIGGNIMPYGLSAAELEIVKKGFGDAALGTKPDIEPDAFRAKLPGFMQAHLAAKAAGEKEKAKAFLAQAEKEPGAQKTSSGMIFTETTKGSGPSPAATDTVKVNYRGTLIDGNEFDSSYKRNEPVEFPLNTVIPCWVEALEKLSVGGKAKVVCPSEIAYGDQGRPPQIPGGATLVFEVELLGINPAGAPAAAKPPAAPAAPKKK